MLKLRSISTLLLFFALTGIVFSQPTLTINAKKATLELLDTRQFKTFLVEDKQKTEVEASWSIEPATLGSFSESGLLTAEIIGTGTIYAQYEDLVASIPVEIKEPDDDEEIVGPKVVIENSEVELFIDDLEPSEQDDGIFLGFLNGFPRSFSRLNCYFVFFFLSEEQKKN